MLSMQKSAFLTSVEAAGGLDVTRRLDLNSQRFLCFTGVSQENGEWLIGVSDGALVWSAGLTENKGQEQGHATTFVKDVSQSLQSGDVKLARSQAGNLLLLVKPALWSSSLELTLQEAPSVQQKEQMSRLLFLLWDKLHATTNKLHACEQSLEKARSTASGSGLCEIAVSTASKAATKQKKTKGASLVNPSSKRRKAATGVVFGDDS